MQVAEQDASSFLEAWLRTSTILCRAEYSITSNRSSKPLPGGLSKRLGFSRPESVCDRSFVGNGKDQEG